MKTTNTFMPFRSLVFLLLFVGCNKDEGFYQKDYLETPSTAIPDNSVILDPTPSNTLPDDLIEVGETPGEEVEQYNEEPEVIEPEVIEPEVVQPEVVQPEVVQPEVVQPEVAQPEVAQPEVIEPEVVQPEVVQPEVVQPEVVQPEVVQPEVVQPEVVQPEVTEPEVVQPEVVQPEVTEPEVVQPEVVEPEVTEPTPPLPVYTAAQDIFTQVANDQKKVDILWVIDNSGSMQDEQNNLSNNFEVFINGFLNKNIDFTMAITTTDTVGNNRGRAVSGSIEKLTSVKAQQNRLQFINDFKSLIKVGIRGSGNEKGLEASVAFLERHQKFTRDGAYFIVVYVTDENDSSAQTPAVIHHLLKVHTKKTDLLKAYSIVNLQGLGNPSSMKLGYDRYEYVTLATGGLLLDIHGNFGQSLQVMGDSILNLLDSFTLSHEPLLSSVQVKVNGLVVDPGSYTISGKNINFAPMFIPPVGSQITVNYNY